jgi:hypothetical protein
VHPTKVATLDGKQVTAVGVGDDFIIALGLTLPRLSDKEKQRRMLEAKMRPKSLDNKLQINRL